MTDNIVKKASHTKNNPAFVAADPESLIFDDLATSLKEQNADKDMQAPAPAEINGVNKGDPLKIEEQLPVWITISTDAIDAWNEFKPLVNFQESFTANE